MKQSNPYNNGMNTCAARGPRMCSFHCCTNLFACTLKAIFVDSTAQPAHRWAIINFLAGFDQERGRFRLWWQVGGLASSRQFLVVMRGPVQVERAALTIFAVILLHPSALRAFCHPVILL